MLPPFESADQLRKWLDHQKWMRQRFVELLPHIQTEDGLVPTSEVIVNGPHMWRLKNDLQVHAIPHWRISEVADYLLAHPQLWRQAAIRLQPSRSIIGRAPVFGVPFHRALQIVQERRLAKSVFWITRKHQQQESLYAYLLVRVTRRKESNGPFVVIESWEWIGEGIEVNYAHMITTPDIASVVHLDGAIVVFGAESDITDIFNTGEKRKGVSYEKYFRLDGDLKYPDAVELVRGYFQVKELVDEYFEYEPTWPPALETPA